MAHRSIGFLASCGLLLASMPSPVKAAWMTGQKLLQVCESEKPGAAIERGICIGYIAAASENFDLPRALKGQRACLPDGVTLGQIEAVVVRYLRNDPSSWHLAADFVVQTALTNAFCKGR